jgi:hypothetical protein
MLFSPWYKNILWGKEQAGRAKPPIFADETNFSVLLDRLSSLSAGSVKPAASARIALRQLARKLGEESDSNQARVILDHTQAYFGLMQAFLIGPGNDLGKPVPIEEAKDHIFGFVLMNDWSGEELSEEGPGRDCGWIL